MKDEGFAVAARLHVAFDGESAGDRRLRRRERIFDDALGLVVQSTVGDRALDEPRGSVDRRQGLISKVASTTASALRGTCETPTALRARRPSAPSRSAMNARGFGRMTPNSSRRLAVSL